MRSPWDGATGSRLTVTAGGTLATRSVHRAPSLAAAWLGATVPVSERTLPDSATILSDPTFSTRSPMAAPVATLPEMDVRPPPTESADPALAIFSAYAATTSVFADPVVQAFVSMLPFPLAVVPGVNGNAGASSNGLVFTLRYAAITPASLPEVKPVQVVVADPFLVARYIHIPSAPVVFEATRVHPAGVAGAVVVLAVSVATSPSPAVHDPGSVRVSEVAAAAVAVATAASRPIEQAIESVTLTWAVLPLRSVIVMTAVYVPAASAFEAMDTVSAPEVAPWARFTAETFGAARFAAPHPALYVTAEV